MLARLGPEPLSPLPLGAPLGANVPERPAECLQHLDERNPDGALPERRVEPAEIHAYRSVRDRLPPDEVRERLPLRGIQVGDRDAPRPVPRFLHARTRRREEPPVRGPAEERPDPLGVHPHDSSTSTRSWPFQMNHSA